MIAEITDVCVRLDKISEQLEIIIERLSKRKLQKPAMFDH